MEIENIQNDRVTVKVDLDRIHSMSVDVLDMFKNTQVGDAVMACALTLARLSAPDTIEVKEETQFLQALLDWVGAYWSKGAN